LDIAIQIVLPPPKGSFQIY